MIEKDRKVKITNRDSGTASYVVQDMNNLSRFFNRGETKEVTFEELRQLSNSTGGRILLQECFLIHDKEVVRELLGEVDPEYNYTEENVESLLLNGSLDQLLDCLDFAPSGVLEIVKDKAVSLKINDIAKREAIKDKLGFDVTKAISINEMTSEDTKEEKKERRANPVSTSEEPVKTRRVTTKKYEIVE